MPEQEEPDEEQPQGKPADESARHRELNKRERAIAALVGTMLVAAGVWVLFVAENDAQFAVGVLFVGGAVMLLMAVQGTPLIRLGAKDVSVELGRRVIAQAKERAATNPSEAEGILKGISAANPAAQLEPEFIAAETVIRSAREYEAFVSGLMQRTIFLGPDGPLGPETRITRATLVGPTSVVVEVDGRDNIVVASQFVQNEPSAILLGLAKRIRFARSLAKSVSGILIITNVRLLPGMRRALADGPKPTAVVVLDELTPEDGIFTPDEKFAEALRELVLTAVQPT